MLSWAETASLAILPNSPSIIHPSKNRKWLLLKRNQLLEQLFINHMIDAETKNLSKLEPIPNKPLKLPQNARHLIQFSDKEIN
jgi:penicillin-binding protein 1C